MIPIPYVAMCFSSVVDVDCYRSVGGTYCITRFVTFRVKLLFVAVIHDACTAHYGSEEPSWLQLPPLEGLTQAGREHLSFVLSAEQIALYRVVTRDAQRFPELGQRYQSEVVQDRLAHLISYFDRWPKSLRTKIKDPLRAAQTFSVLLQGDLLETALFAGRIPGQKELRTRAQDAATGLLTLIKAGLV